MNRKSNITQLIYLIIGLLVLNGLSRSFYHRLDLTNDQRYTLSNTSIDIVKNAKKPIYINVYLKGNFPAEFKRLQFETEQLLEELKSENRSIRFSFIDPIDQAQELMDMGLEPSQLSVQQNGVTSEIIIFPWATVAKGERMELVSLLSDTNSQSQEEQLERAIQNLEFAFVDAIHKVNSKKDQKIAVLKGKGELDDLYLFDFLQTVSSYYRLAPFTLDAVATDPIQTLRELNDFDLVLLAKPTERFTEDEKYVLDQYIMQGGKSLWMLDNVHAEMDSLMLNGETLAYPRDLNLTDLLFQYGVRLEPDLILDLYAAKIPLATGNVGNQTQFNEFLWPYFPAVLSGNNHPINRQLLPIKFQFVSSIDTLKNDISKTVLLESSSLSKTVGVPSIVSLDILRSPSDPAQFNKGKNATAVLLEGQFKSAYADRVQPFEIDFATSTSTPNRMIVIADGDVASNQITRGQPEQLGIDKYTGQRFGNKEFMMNAINYLLDDSGLIQLRNKTVDLNVLDRQKSFQERNFYQVLNLILPLLLLSLFGLIFTFDRRRRFHK